MTGKFPPVCTVYRYISRPPVFLPDASCHAPFLPFLTFTLCFDFHPLLHLCFSLPFVFVFISLFVFSLSTSFYVFSPAFVSFSFVFLFSCVARHTRALSFTRELSTRASSTCCSLSALSSILDRSTLHDDLAAVGQQLFELLLCACEGTRGNGHVTLRSESRRATCVLNWFNTARTLQLVLRE